MNQVFVNLKVVLFGIDLSHLHLEDDGDIVLLHSKALVVLQCIALLAFILGNELIHDWLGHEDEINTLSEALLDLILLPKELDLGISQLVVLLLKEKTAEINAPGWLSSVDAVQIFVGLTWCGCDDVGKVV